MTGYFIPCEKKTEARCKCHNQQHDRKRKLLNSRTCHKVKPPSSVNGNCNHHLKMHKINGTENLQADMTNIQTAFQRQANAFTQNCERNSELSGFTVSQLGLRLERTVDVTVTKRVNSNLVKMNASFFFFSFVLLEPNFQLSSHKTYDNLSKHC